MKFLLFHCKRCLFPLPSALQVSPLKRGCQWLSRYAWYGLSEGAKNLLTLSNMVEMISSIFVVSEVMASKKEKFCPTLMYSLNVSYPSFNPDVLPRSKSLIVSTLETNPSKFLNSLDPFNTPSSTPVIWIPALPNFSPYPSKNFSLNALLLSSPVVT